MKPDGEGGVGVNGNQVADVHAAAIPAHADAVKHGQDSSNTRIKS